MIFLVHFQLRPAVKSPCPLKKGTGPFRPSATGESLETIDGSRDPLALAADKQRVPWRALRRGPETAIEFKTTGQSVAWYADGFNDAALHPSGRCWASFQSTDVQSTHVYLVVLEGETIGVVCQFEGRAPTHAEEPASALTADDWYYSLDHRRASGPVTSAELKQLIESGKIPKDAWVSRDKKKWHGATKLRGVQWPV